MNRPNHYDTLGLSKTASREEIKAAFRKLSMATHPDVAKEGDATIEKFKTISEAHSVLSNKTERYRYDRQLADAKMWRPQGGAGAYGGGNGFYGGGNFDRPGTSSGRPTRRGMHMAMESIFHPRGMFLGLVGFCGLVAITSMVTGGEDKSTKFQQHTSPMVEAWMNPKTGQWEQPTPWDPTYRKLQPTLQLVPRDKVKRTNM
jgi:curved DNA-binding protein CbpA